MADSLDDFFAKKDKNKRMKNKGKVSSSDQVSRKNEDLGKKTEKSLKKDKEKFVSSGNTQSIISNPAQEQVQEEWNEVDDEEKDYSGLRVQALTIDKEKEEEQLKDQLTQEDGEEAHCTEGPQGPWKKSSSAAADPESPDAEKDEDDDDDDDELEQEAPVVSQPETPAVTKYVPPSRRSQMSSGTSSTPSSAGRRYNKSVPEMTSELHFPSLSSAIDPSPQGARSQMNDRSFQSVKHGSRFKDDMSQSGVHLDLENKYAALRRRDN